MSSRKPTRLTPDLPPRVEVPDPPRAAPRGKSRSPRPPAPPAEGGRPEEHPPDDYSTD
jgi:hypothetical protein